MEKSMEQLKREVEAMRSQAEASLVYKTDPIKIYHKELVKQAQEMAKTHAQLAMEQLQEASGIAVSKVISLVQSPNEGIATKNAHFVINHAIGMPTQKNINQNFNHNIDNLLD